MSEPLTLMAVHAHPDDESSSTGGILARYSSEGLRTVVVTCTNGELGDGPGGVKPGHDGHDEEEVVRIRREELAQACARLGVSHLEVLGYRDSGMASWDYKDRPDAFCNVPVTEAGRRLAEVFERYQPAVVVTYADDSGYDHPDHVHTSLVTMEAVKRSRVPRKAYFSAFRASGFTRFLEILEEHHIEIPGDWSDPSEWMERMAALEARITTTIDIGPFVERKREALALHTSQIEESFFARLPSEAFGAVFGEEHFVRVMDTTHAPVPEDDLFAGLR